MLVKTWLVFTTNNDHSRRLTNTMTTSSNSREERLAQIISQINALHDPSGGVEPAELGVSNEDVALLFEAIDSGELWRLLEARPELDLAPSEASTSFATAVWP